MPVAPRATRFECLDTLRGFAVLGILMVNVQFFAMVWAVDEFPYVQGNFDAPINRAVWWITETFFTLKFITLFSAMFGAGIILMLGTGEAVHKRHWRRMLFLLMFGLIHAYVFWYGDILVPYALAGMVIVTARRMSIGGLFWLGTGLTAFTGLLVVGQAAIGVLLGDDTSWAEARGITSERIVEITALYQSGFLERMPYNAGTAVMFELIQLVMFSGRIAGVMLIGMAAFRSGFLTLGWARQHYLLSAAIAIPLGVLLCGWQASHLLATDFAPSEAWKAAAAQYVGSMILAFGYASGIMLMAQSGWLKPVTGILAYTGRMAFTNYLTQTLIMTFIFVGFPGLGLFGTVDRAGQALIVLAVWALQLVWSPLWLSTFRFGPMEWLWRTLTYGKPQPWKRVRPAGDGA